MFWLSMLACTGSGTVTVLPDTPTEGLPKGFTATTSLWMPASGEVDYWYASVEGLVHSGPTSLGESVLLSTRGPGCADHQVHADASAALVSALEAEHGSDVTSLTLTEACEAVTAYYEALDEVDWPSGGSRLSLWPTGGTLVESTFTTPDHELWNPETCDFDEPLLDGDYTWVDIDGSWVAEDQGQTLEGTLDGAFVFPLTGATGRVETRFSAVRCDLDITHYVVL